VPSAHLVYVPRGIATTFATWTVTAIQTAVWMERAPFLLAHPAPTVPQDIAAQIVFALLEVKAHSVPQTPNALPEKVNVKFKALCLRCVRIATLGAAVMRLRIVSRAHLVTVAFAWLVNLYVQRVRA